MVGGLLMAGTTFASASSEAVSAKEAKVFETVKCKRNVGGTTYETTGGGPGESLEDAARDCKERLDRIENAVS